MRVAIFSPLNPVKSGISDFTEELVVFLKKYMDIDLFIDGFKPSNEEIAKQFNIYRMEEMDKPGVREKIRLSDFPCGEQRIKPSKNGEIPAKIRRNS